MKVDIDLVERQRDVQNYVFPLREEVFVRGLGYGYADNQVMCSIDSVSNHYIWLMNGEPAGVISVADLSGIDFLLDELWLDKNLRVGKPHKFAVKPELRRQVDIRTLLSFVQDEIVDGYDFVTAHTCRPAGQPDFVHHLKMADSYCRYFGLEVLPVNSAYIGDDKVILGRAV